MTKDITATKCTNCKYYQRYYIVAYGCMFKPTDLGHCINMKVNAKDGSACVKKNSGCALWQPYELEKLRQQYSIEAALEKTDKTLNAILEVLRDAK